MCEWHDVNSSDVHRNCSAKVSKALGVDKGGGRLCVASCACDEFHCRPSLWRGLLQAELVESFIAGWACGEVLLQSYSTEWRVCKESHSFHHSFRHSWISLKLSKEEKKRKEKKREERIAYNLPRAMKWKVGELYVALLRAACAARVFIDNPIALQALLKAAHFADIPRALRRNATQRNLQAGRCFARIATTIRRS